LYRWYKHFCTEQIQALQPKSVSLPLVHLDNTVGLSSGQQPLKKVKQVLRNLLRKSREVAINLNIAVH